MKLWIARDKDGCLCLHDEKPYCSANGVWYSIKQMMHLSKDLYPEIIFENSPQEVEVKLCNNDTLDKVKEKLSKIKDLHPEFAKIIEEDFWDLVF